MGKYTFPRTELLRAAIYACILFWINAYICRELFFIPTAYMNSMHGFWIAISKLAGGGWFHPTWWPYWDEGIPFEFTYSPLLPALMAAWHGLTGINPGLAFGRITGFAYCLSPVILFLAVWLLTRSPGASFAASVIYSLTSPTQLFAPDPASSVRGFRDPRRLMLVAAWDDTPHLLALLLLPLTIFFLARSIETRRPRYYAAAILSIAIAGLASAFGPVEVLLASLCLLFVLERKAWVRNIATVAAIGIFAYAMIAAWLPPSLLVAMRRASNENGQPVFAAGSLIAFAIVAAGWAVLWQILRRCTTDWRIRFFALFAWLTSSIPLLSDYLHRQFLPQTIRYKMEAELAIAVLVALLGWKLLKRLPQLPRIATVIFLVAIAAVQVVHQRHYAKNLLRRGDPTQTIEDRTAVWAARNLPGVRIFLPGSLGEWGNAFAPDQQFGGSSWSQAYNPVQQEALDAMYYGFSAETDAPSSIAWLKAFGAGAVAVPGKNSPEYWKPFTHPKKFEGVLPALWTEDDVTIFQIPERSTSFAHVITPSGLLRSTPSSIDSLQPYLAALGDPSLPLAKFSWQGRNRAQIDATATPGELISIQVSYHPGWHAMVNGRDEPLRRDGLGLMWLDPQCSGACQVQLSYDGGLELRLCRYLSYAAMLLFVVLFPIRPLIKVF